MVPMPLQKGAAQKTVSRNIAERTHSDDRPHKQNVAIALSMARESMKKKGTEGKTNGATRY
jgi:hypothetical protein